MYMLLNILMIVFVFIEFLIGFYLIHHPKDSFLGLKIMPKHTQQLKKFSLLFVIVGIFTLITLYLANITLIAIMLIIGMILSSILLFNVANLFKG